MLDPFVARTIRDEPADLISVKVGINLVNGDTMRERTFGPALHGFLDTIREGHPDTPLLVISPIWCGPVEDHPGPTIVRDGRCATVEGLDALRQTCLTLTKIRRTIASIVATRRDLGDEHLHHLDGLELFGPADAGDLPDDLHPNAAGYVRIGERFAAAAFGPGGAFASS
jgi:lysophospholipase L1-like esterase